MSQKHLSVILSAAGWFVGVIVAAVLLVYVPLFDLPLLRTPYRQIGFVVSLVSTLLFEGALYHYLMICKRIGKNNSFCIENAQHLLWIARLMGMMAVEVAVVTVGIVCSREFFPAYSVSCMIVACAAGGLAVIAWALSQLVRHAANLQEENDLTI